MGSLGFMDHPRFGDRFVCRLCGCDAHIGQGPSGDPGQGLHLRVTRAVAELSHRVLRSDCRARLAPYSLTEITKEIDSLKRRQRPRRSDVEAQASSSFLGSAVAACDKARFRCRSRAGSGPTCRCQHLEPAAAVGLCDGRSLWRPNIERSRWFSEHW